MNTNKNTLNELITINGWLLDSAFIWKYSLSFMSSNFKGARYTQTFMVYFIMFVQIVRPYNMRTVQKRTLNWSIATGHPFGDCFCALQIEIFLVFAIWICFLFLYAFRAACRFQVDGTSWLATKATSWRRKSLGVDSNN